MRILSFDTSASELHISLLDDRNVVFERRSEPSSSERQEVAALIMPEIDRAYAEAGWSKSAADLIVVGVGPGSFTGIRVAVITARTLCQIFKLPCVPVCLLDTYYASLQTREPAAVVLGSTPPQCFYAAYGPAETDPASPRVQPAVGPAAAIPEALNAFSNWYCDEKAAAVLGEHPHILLPKLKNVGTIQAQLAYDRLSLNGFAMETFAWQNVLPLYLRAPSVTLKKNYAPPTAANESR